jgi:DNA polymerase
MEFPKSPAEVLKYLKLRGITQIAALDFETYFDTDYSLRKKGMSTTEYIRHDLFKAQSVAVRLYPSGRKINGLHEDVERIVVSIDWSTTALLCHHAQFDGLILTHHYRAVPAYYLCSLSMARPIHGGSIPNDLDSIAKHYGVGNKLPEILNETKGVRTLPSQLAKRLLTYNKQDVDVMWKVFVAILDLQQFSTNELDLINYTIRGYTEPVLRVNKSLAKREHKKEIQRRLNLVKATGCTETQLRSREQFANLLREQGVTPPTKTSPVTNETTYAFAKNDIALQELMNYHKNEKVRNLIAARLVVSSSINETRAKRILSHGDKGNLPIYLKYGGAHTLRWSGGDLMNPQNFPRTSPLRQAMCAPPEHVLIVVDSGQIEARGNAWLAGQSDLIEQFKAKDAGDDSKDPYKIMAMEFFEIPFEEVNSIQRFVGKTGILGLGYQLAGTTLYHTLISGKQGPPVKCTENECRSWVDTYRRKNSKIVDQWEFMQEKALPRMGGKLSNDIKYGPIIFKKGGYVSANGMFMAYPRLRTKTASTTNKFNTSSIDVGDWVYKESTNIYGGKLTENVIQNLARHIVAGQILEVSDDYRLVLQAHDEGVWCVPKKQAEEALDRILKAFATPPDWAPDLPVVGEGVISRTYVKP